MCTKTVEISNPRDRSQKLQVPCGKCPQCRTRSINSWLFRLKQEMKVSSNPLFVTLTYDDQHLPLSPNGLPTLRKRDTQLFFKRLRKRLGTSNLRYYLCGEYGTKTQRPHYHIILFNLSDSSLITEAWQNGFTYQPKVKEADMRYVLKYISKSKTKPHSGDDRLREFSLMSLGIGKNYMSDQIKDYHRSVLERCYVVTSEGYKMPIPRYYKEKLFDDQMKEDVSQILADRAREAEECKIKEAFRSKNVKTRLDAQILLEYRGQHSKFAKRNEKL